MKSFANNAVSFHYLARVAVALAVATIALTGSVPAQDVGTATAETLSAANVKRPYSPYAGGAVPNRVFWGDTHLHTSYSMDAGMPSATASAPRRPTALPGARRWSLSAGGPARLARPLDFLVVADHSDNMGFFPDLFAGEPDILADPTGKEWYDLSRRAGAWRRSGDHRLLLARHVSRRRSCTGRTARCTARPGRKDDRRSREVQRAGPLHRLHRLRVDLAGAPRAEPAPGGDLPRRSGDKASADGPGHHLSPAGQHRPGVPVEASAGLRGQDRR